jgi:hypothetical protein
LVLSQRDDVVRRVVRQRRVEIGGSSRPARPREPRRRAGSPSAQPTVDDGDIASANDQPDAAPPLPKPVLALPGAAAAAVVGAVRVVGVVHLREQTQAPRPRWPQRRRPPAPVATIELLLRTCASEAGQPAKNASSARVNSSAWVALSPCGAPFDERELAPVDRPVSTLAAHLEQDDGVAVAVDDERRRRSASRTRHSMLSRPSSSARRLVASTIAPAKSLTITRPVDPTSAAAENPTTPVPAARSWISSPGDGSRSGASFQFRAERSPRSRRDVRPNPAPSPPTLHDSRACNRSSPYPPEA